MKKLLTILAASTLAFGVAGCASNPSTDKNDTGCDTLKVFNWGEYVGEGVISDFEREYGVKVIYDLYDTNESMYTKLQSGDVYDILVPSDYMIQRLLQEDMLQPLDFDRIPNFENINPALKSLDADPSGEYSVPYFYGNVGIVYNKENVSLADLEKEGYDIFKDPKYKGKIYMYDSERDAFMMAFKALGYSMNTENSDEISAAYNWLLELNNTMDPVYVTDEVIDNMVNGVKDLALVYSGDATYILSENEDMGFYLPESGTNKWVDSFVIPKNAACPALANEFINYMISEDVAYNNSETVGYTSSVSVVEEALAEELYAGIDAYKPRLDNPNDEYFSYNETLKKALADLWIKVKAN
ncbi:MAG: ABC transporter substrate-binding protein [Erysipelotrichaceae bacterium]